MESFEDKIITDGIMTREQIEQIREMFSMIDTDKSGSLSYEELAALIRQITNGSVTEEEGMKLIAKMDPNKDGIIEWQEFLQAMCEWLNSTGVLKDKDFMRNGTLLNFSHDKVINGLETLLNQSNSVEDRPDSWDFFSTKLNFTKQEKWKFYEENESLLKSFSEISIKIAGNDYQEALVAVQSVVKLLSIVAIFKTPADRFEISQHVLRVFDLIENSLVISKIYSFICDSNDIALITECLKVVALYASGPRIANTPEDNKFHPNKHYYKSIFTQSEIHVKIVELIGSEDNLLRRQAILTVGFLSRGFSHYRELFNMQKVPGMLALLSQNLQLALEDGRAISWTLSILAGSTIPNPSDMDKESIIEFVNVISTFLYWQDDEECITNALIGLSYLLVYIDIDDKNIEVWRRTVMMMTHTSTYVKRAALQCIKKILPNFEQTSLLLQNNLITMISDLFNYTDLDLKSEAIEIILLLGANGGYAWEVLQNSSILTNLKRIIYEDSELRWAAVQVINGLSSKATDFNAILINNDVIKTLFVNLHNFKGFDRVLKEIYGYLEPTYNFTYLIDNLCALNNIVTVFEGNHDQQEYLNVLVNYLDQTCFEKIQQVIEIYFSDLDKGLIPTLMVQQYHDSICTGVTQFLGNCVKIFENAKQTMYTSKMVNSILDLASYVQSSQEKFQQFVKNYGLQHSSSLEIRCFSVENYPNGDNRNLMDMQLNIKLLELLIRIEDLYKKSPVCLYYFLENNEQISVNSDDILTKIIENTANNRKFYDSGHPVLNLVVVSPLKKHLRDYKSAEDTNSSIFDKNIIEIFQKTDLQKKDSLISELTNKTQLNPKEIEQIHNRFIQVTSKRLTNKTSGTVSIEEFAEIMRPIVNDDDTILDLFKAVDTSGTGSIDFRDFVCAISIIKGNSLEDKLRLAFNSYDLDKNGFIDKDEMVQMLKASAHSRGFFTDDRDIIANVEKVFQGADQNGDGVLSFTEFKLAVTNNINLINAFWTDSNKLNFASQNIFLTGNNRNLFSKTNNY